MNCDAFLLVVACLLLEIRKEFGNFVIFLKMSVSRRKTTEPERKIIINLHKLWFFFPVRCKSIREIGRIVGRTHSTVQGVIYRFSVRKTIKNKTKSWRPKKVNDQDRRFVIRTIKQDPKMSAPKIAAEPSNRKGTTVSASTVRNIHRNSGYHERTARKKYFKWN